MGSPRLPTDFSSRESEDPARGIMEYFDKRIRFYFSSAILLAIALFVFSLLTLLSIVKSKDELLNNHVMRVVYFKELEVLLERDVARNRAFAISGDPSLLREGQKIHVELLDHLQKIRDAAFGSHTDELVDAIERAKESFIPAEQKLIDLRQRIPPAKGVAKFFEDEVRPYRVAMTEAVSRAADYEEKEFLKARGEIQTSIRRGVQTFIVGGVLLLVAGAVFFRLFYLTRKEITDAFDKLETERKKLARSNKELEEFAGVAAHDLRAPLKTMHGWVDVLNSVLPRPRSLEVDSAMNFIVSNTRKSCALVEDLLAVARLNIDVPMTRVDLDQTIHCVLDVFAPEIQVSGAVILVEKMPTVWGNASHLEMIFSNLISNALVYRNKGRRPQIIIGACAHGGYHEFFVKDNGIGIRPEHYSRIFEMFTRLHNDNAFPGTGIGLAFVKKIVELNRGKIWLESTLGKGTTFFFTYYGYANSNQRREGSYETRRHDSR